MNLLLRKNDNENNLSVETITETELIFYESTKKMGSFTLEPPRGYLVKLGDIR